jgi:hypothetical protein
MTPLAWSFLLSALGIVGLLLAGSKRKVGWLVGVAVQPLWIVFAITTQQYGFILNAGIYAAVYARNYILWRRSDHAAHPSYEDEVRRDVHRQMIDNHNRLVRERAADPGDIYDEIASGPAD